MTDILLRARRSFELPPSKEGRLVLETSREWLLDGLPNALDEIANQLPEYVERLAPNVICLNFRHSIGRYTLPGIGDIEVVSHKLSEADFDGMLREMTDIASALPFSRRIGSGLPYDRVHSKEARVPYHAFVYLRYSLSEAAAPEDRLDLAIRRILSEPHHRMSAIDNLVAIGQAKSVETRGLLRTLTSPWRWQEARGNESAMARALGGHLPEAIEEGRRIRHFDTPENRFVRSVLDLANGIIEATRSRARAWTQGFREPLLRDCERMSRTLGSLRRHALWRDVGNLVHFPAGSSVLQRRYGYREVLRHFVRLRLMSRIPLAPRAARDWLALKDIATLYELYCFFAVAKSIRNCIGSPSSADMPEVEYEQMTAPWGMRIAWPDGTELLYNASFRRSSKSRRSTSLPLRPDVALRIPSGKNRGWHLFDAKFRLEHLQSFDADDDDDSVSTFKRDDLYKMHTYRDAIVDAASVWILYPGTTRKFFPAEFEAPDGGHRGVGAVPVKPGGGELDEVLRELLGVD